MIELPPNNIECTDVLHVQALALQSVLPISLPHRVKRIHTLPVRRYRVTVRYPNPDVRHSINGIGHLLVAQSGAACNGRTDSGPGSVVL